MKKFIRNEDILPPVICVEASDEAGARHLCQEVGFPAQVRVKNGRPGFGNIRAQIAMMSGDKLCPDADFTWLLGSDCIFTREFSTKEFFSPEGKPNMFITGYELLLRTGNPCATWLPGTRAIMGFEPQFEFMRMLPLIYPRRLFPHARDFLSEKFNGSFENVCHSLVKPSERCDSGFSESNIMGAFAYRFMPELYNWIVTDPEPAPQFNSPMTVFWSHGGLDRPMDIGKVQGTDSPTGPTPRQVITQVLGSC